MKPAAMIVVVAVEISFVAVVSVVMGVVVVVEEMAISTVVEARV